MTLAPGPPRLSHCDSISASFARLSAAARFHWQSRVSTRGLPVWLLSDLATPHASVRAETNGQREIALLRAENCVEHYASEGINVRDICRAAARRRIRPLFRTARRFPAADRPAARTWELQELESVRSPRRSRRKITYRFYGLRLRASGCIDV